MDVSSVQSRSSWFALTVKPQHERAAAFALQAKGLEDYLPLFRDRRRWSDRVKEIEVPLFPGYVFCRFAPGQRTAVLATPGVRSVVSFAKTPAPVPEQEIESIRTMVASGLPVGPWPFLKVGQAVRIERGALCGLEGILVQLKDSWRVVVSVPLLQRSVAVEIDRDLVAAVTQTGQGRIAPSSCEAVNGAHVRNFTAA